MAQVFSFIAVALRHSADSYSIGPGLNAGTINRRNIQSEVTALEDQAFSYENFWRLIARSECQRDGCWDTANLWAMKKLGVYDEVGYNRKSHYCLAKVQGIEHDTGKWLASWDCSS